MNKSKTILYKNRRINQTKGQLFHTILKWGEDWHTRGPRVGVPSPEGDGKPLVEVTDRMCWRQIATESL